MLGGLLRCRYTADTIARPSRCEGEPCCRLTLNQALEMTRFLHAARWASACTLALLAGALACDRATAPIPPLPPGARVFTPEPVFREWWAQMEGCSGRTGSFDAVTWYVVPGEDPFPAPGVGQPVHGYWHPSDNRIVLLEWVPSRSSLVRHEALHAILRRSDHPEEYFVAKCGAVINAPGLIID
jgi:hypothetical protein